MMNMIEKVARAIYAADSIPAHTKPWEEAGAEAHEIYYDMAKAAIQAMRFQPHALLCTDDNPARTMDSDRFNAIIDAALKENAS